MKHLTLIQFQYKKTSTPLGALYLAYGLEKEKIDFDLKIFPYYKSTEETHFYFDFKQYPFYKRTPSKKSVFNLGALYAFFSQTRKIVAIGCWSDLLPHVLVALKKLKEKHPEKVIILGGIGPTVVAEDILKRFKFIDYIIKGCGVIPLPQLIKKIIDNDNELSNVTGLVYRLNGMIISNPYAGYHLTIPPLPAYHRLKNIQQYYTFTMITSCGCPFECTYCTTRPVSPKKIIYRDLNETIEEIKFIQSTAKQKKFDFEISIDDEAFVVNRKRMMRFCNLLLSNKLKIKWTCFGRINCMDEKLIKKMARAGCAAIHYGIESGSDRILEKIKKGFTIERALTILLLSKKYIPIVVGNFIYMFPFETRKDLIKTLIVALAIESKNINVGFTKLTPVKNSEIYREYEKSLHFSLKVPTVGFDQMYRLPKECISLIRKNQKIFYNFYHFKFKGLPELIHLQELYKIVKFFKIASNKLFEYLSTVSDGKP